MHEDYSSLETASAGKTVRTDIVLIVLASVAVKALQAWCLPFTGDEAYFAVSGRDLAWGYYDHPPMVFWLLHLLFHLGSSPLLMRSLPVICSTAVGIGIYVLLRPYDARKAFLAFVLFTVSPINTAFFVVTTDSPLLLFSFLSVLFLCRAETKQSYLYYLLSGVFFGLAFLSKYFVLLLAASYLLYLLIVRKDARRLKGFFLLALAALPFIAQNVLWNYFMGWPNIMHNLINRVRRDSNPALNLLAFTAYLIYLVTPPVLYFLFRNRTHILKTLRKSELRIFGVLSLVPLLIFFVVLVRKSVGPHWYVSFLPFAYIAVVLIIDNKQVVKCIRFSFTFSIVQACLVIAAAFAPIQELEPVLKPGDMTSLVTSMRPKEVLDVFREYQNDFILATTSYSTSSQMEFYSGQRFIVFGKGSRHARQDDIRTDFRDLDGKNIAILRETEEYDPRFKECFKRMEVKRLRIEGATFTLLLGHGFKYGQYLELILKTSVARGYYRIPDWLPGSRSFFHEKYGIPRKKSAGRPRR